jgi:hypothetical protein
VNANNQFKQGPEREIGTDNTNGPESERTDVAMLELMLFLH